MKKIYFSVILVIGGLLLAQQVFALTISPPVFEIGGDPGRDVQGYVKLFNETSKDITVYTSTLDFGAKKGEEGEPAFYTPTEKENDLSKWIEINPGPITIPPLAWQRVPFTVKIPSYADPGGHYAAIFFGPQPPGKGRAVGVSSKVGTLVLLRVSGDIHEEGRLISFSLKNKEKFYEYLPIDFLVRFENLGNVHLKPQGEIVIKDIIGRKVGVVDFNKVKAGGNVLPKSIRRFEASWVKTPLENPPSGFFGKLKAEKENFALGRYTADLNLEYGTKLKKASASLIFWVLPWQLILVCLIILIFLIILIIFGVKRYNKWIIKKALIEQRREEK